MSTNPKKLPAACCPPPARKAFTLVEMLVVITIIGILAALGTPAVFKALEASKKARIKAEITNLESALQQFKTQYGDFPPSDFSGDLTQPDHPVRRFMARAYPRIAETDAGCWQLLKNTDGTPLSSGQAMCFWLRGFFKDPAYPLTSNKGDRTPFFDFDASRLYDPISDSPYTPGGNIPVYKPQGSKVPYVYFSARSYADHNGTRSFSYPKVPGSGTCIPYLWDVNGDGVVDTKDYDANNNTKLDDSEIPKLYANPKSFQLIAAGLDNDYGTAPSSSTKTFSKTSGTLTLSTSKTYPVGTGYDASGADDDNITNFSERSLGDAKP
jgi:prepilin-type N-terminal cleavage/methylation domain-containing protein